MYQTWIENMLIYAKHTVPHILSGGAFAHATRAHLITAGVLSALLIGNVHNIDFDLNVDNKNFASKFHEALNGKEELSKLDKIMDKILTKKIASDDLTMLHDPIISIQEKLKHHKENLHENKTAKLWLTYIEMVNIVCKITSRLQNITKFILRQFLSVYHILQQQDIINMSSQRTYTSNL